jgi:hypothetical protein
MAMETLFFDLHGHGNRCQFTMQKKLIGERILMQGLGLLVDLQQPERKRSMKKE